jgi:hypothetical protein
MKPIFDDQEAIAAGVAPLTDEALEVNKKTREELSHAPDKLVVWKNFCDFVDKYNFKKNNWGAPISVGYNSDGFDYYIATRLCREVGRFDEEYGKQTLFNPIFKKDLMQIIHDYTENSRELKSYSFDSIREWLGLSKEGAHDAKVDVLQGARVFVRFMQLTRRVAQKTKFKGAMRE